MRNENLSDVLIDLLPMALTLLLACDDPRQPLHITGSHNSWSNDSHWESMVLRERPATHQYDTSVTEQAHAPSFQNARPMGLPNRLHQKPLVKCTAFLLFSACTINLEVAHSVKLPCHVAKAKLGLSMSITKPAACLWLLFRLACHSFHMPCCEDVSTLVKGLSNGNR